MNPLPVPQHGVLSLARNPGPGLLERAHSIEVIDARNLGQVLYRDLDFANLFALELLFHHGKVLSDSIPNVLQGFWFRSSLGPTPRQSRHGDAISFVRFVNRNLVFHRTSAGNIARLPERRRTFELSRLRRLAKPAVAGRLERRLHTLPLDSLPGRRIAPTAARHAGMTTGNAKTAAAAPGTLLFSRPSANQMPTMTDKPASVMPPKMPRNTPNALANLRSGCFVRRTYQGAAPSITTHPATETTMSPSAMSASGLRRYRASAPRTCCTAVLRGADRIAVAQGRRGG